MCVVGGRDGEGVPQGARQNARTERRKDYQQANSCEMAPILFNTGSTETSFGGPRKHGRQMRSPLVSGVANEGLFALLAVVSKASGQGAVRTQRGSGKWASLDDECFPFVEGERV